MSEGEKGCVQTIPVTIHRDARGALVPIEEGAPLPFNLARVFVIKDVPANAKRGSHKADCNQFLLVITGSCSATTDNGSGNESLELQAGAPGLFVPEGTWIELHSFAPGTILLVACSARYTPRGGGAAGI